VSTILVTGASGFIGSRLCERLVAEGHGVHGVSRTPRISHKDSVQWWPADLADGNAVRTLLTKVRPNIVFHLASRVTGSREICEVEQVFLSDLASTVHVLTSAVDAGCERIVLAGSSEEPKQLDSGVPCSPYAVAKWSSTAYASMFRALFQTPVIVPRIFMTYGPGQRDTTKVIPFTITSLLRGERPKLSSGKRLVDWIYIDDVTDGLIRAAFSSTVKDLTFDLGSGSLVSIRDVAEQIVQIVDNGIEPDFGALPDRPLEQERAADVALTEHAFRWKPSVSLRAGLEATVKWYRELRNAALYVASFVMAFAPYWFDLCSCPDASMT